MVEGDIALISHSHDRKAHYKSTANELYNLINNYTDQKDLKDFYNYFYKKYNLPMDVVKQTVRQHIAKSYLSKSCKFNSILKTKNIPKSILEYGALIYALFFTKYKKKIKNYELIIDNISSSLELKRFEKLLNLVGGDKTLCVTREIDFKENFPNYEFYIKRRFRDIDISDLLKAIFNEFFLGIFKNIFKD